MAVGRLHAAGAAGLERSCRGLHERTARNRRDPAPEARLDSMFQCIANCWRGWAQCSNAIVTDLPFNVFRGP